MYGQILNPWYKQGHYGITFTQSAFEPQFADFNVIETDYYNYALIFSCVSIGWGAVHDEMYWILTRDPLLG